MRGISDTGHKALMPGVTCESRVSQSGMYTSPGADLHVNFPYKSHPPRPPSFSQSRLRHVGTRAIPAAGRRRQSPGRRTTLRSTLESGCILADCTSCLHYYSDTIIVTCDTTRCVCAATGTETGTSWPSLVRKFGRTHPTRPVWAATRAHLTM
jgi:hypothetical protein